MQTINKFIWAVLPFIAACSGIDVRTDYDAAADFSRYKTYYWAKTPTTPNPLNADRIVAELDGQFSAKGWQRVAEEGQADAAIAAHVTTREQERIDTMYNNMGPGWYGPAYVGAWGGARMSTSTVTYTTIGTLIVDIFDAKSRKGIWHGTAEGTVSKDNQKNRKKIAEAVAEMFKNFPPFSGASAPSR